MNSRIVRGTRVFGATLLGALLAAPAAATVVPETAVGEACEGDEGVTVIVDFSDLGGDVEVGCAEGEQDSGRSALESAGFEAEDVNFPGMVDTIDSMPDPVPEEFDGNFWAYWFVNDDGDWESYMVGFDESTPAPGATEGWRYSDGSLAPGVEGDASADDTGEDAGDDGADDDAAEDDATQEDAAEEDAAENEADADADDADAAEDTGSESSSSTGIWIGAIAAVAVIGAIIAIVVRRKNAGGLS